MSEIGAERNDGMDPSPAISWLQQSIIFFLLGAVLLVGPGITFWLRQDLSPRSSPADTGSQTEA